jgi:hypothetical protein
MAGTVGFDGAPKCPFPYSTYLCGSPSMLQPYIFMLFFSCCLVLNSCNLKPALAGATSKRLGKKFEASSNGHAGHAGRVIGVASRTGHCGPKPALMILKARRQLFSRLACLVQHDQHFDQVDTAQGGPKRPQPLHVRRVMTILFLIRPDAASTTNL